MSGPEGEELSRTEQRAGLRDHAHVLLLSLGHFLALPVEGGRGLKHKETKMILGPDSFLFHDHVLGMDR